MEVQEPSRDELIATLKYIQRIWDNAWLGYVIECTLNNDFDWAKEDE